MKIAKITLSGENPYPVTLSLIICTPIALPYYPQLLDYSLVPRL